MARPRAQVAFPIVVRSDQRGEELAIVTEVTRHAVLLAGDGWTWPDGTLVTARFLSHWDTTEIVVAATTMRSPQGLRLLLIGIQNEDRFANGFSRPAPLH